MPDFPIVSTLEIINIETGVRREVYSCTRLFEAPNWSRDGKFLVFNQDGLLHKIPVVGGQPEAIFSGSANKNNNDHGISPDGDEIAISHHSTNDNGDSIIYIMPIGGGEPRRITALGPSYWHGWSPDNKRLVYVAGRKHSRHYNIYSVDVDGDNETQLTFTDGLDDGPDYSPCGKYIYYNSYRAEKMQIWRMLENGKEQTQFIHSPHSDWFPHPSPDGKYLVFLRYLNDMGQDHPFGQEVKLMLLHIESHKLRDLTGVFYGGQGTINVPSWSPDSKEFAFVSYEKMTD